MEIERIKVAVQKWWIEDVLALRMFKFGVKLEDLFLVLPCPKGEQGETELETKFGNLKVFLVSDMPEGKAGLILHNSKFPYPRKGNPIENLPNEKMNYARERIS